MSNSLQDFITETGIVPVHKTCSDHGIPFVKLKGLGIPSRGPGLWKFNNQLLNDQSFISEMKELLPNWVNEAEQDLPGDTGIQWGFIKHKIGEFSRSYGAKLKKAKMILKLEIEKDLKILHENLNEANKHQYKLLESKLNEIIENEVKGTILRSLVPIMKMGRNAQNISFRWKNIGQNKRQLVGLSWHVVPLLQMRSSF